MNVCTVPIVRKPLLEMVIQYIKKQKYMNGFEIKVRKM